MAGVPLLIGLLATLPAASASLSDAAVLEQAENAYLQACSERAAPAKARSLFAQAAAGYEALRDRGYRNAVLYRNQGNAYLQAGDLARAIVAYHRGLRQAPQNVELRANLAVARDLVVFPAAGSLGRPPTDHWPPWLPRLAPSWRLLLACMAYLAGWLCFTRWWMVRRTGWLWWTGATVMVAALLAANLVVDQNQQATFATHPLVVIDRDGTMLRQGNGLRYPPRFDTPVNRGVEARLRFERGQWVQIELTGELIAWVPRRDVVIDEP